MKIKKLLWIIIFNVLIIISEVVFGIISNSFALIADALHNTGDVMALVVTYIALRFGVKQTTFKYTFGFLKAEMMAAFVNTLFLMITMVYIVYEAISRLFSSEVIEPVYMIVVGIIALLANGISAYLLAKMNIPHEHHHHEHDHHHHHEDINIKSAYLHMLLDALISAGVVIAGIFIYFFKVYSVDAYLTILFSLYILYHSYPVLKKSFLSLMDANTLAITESELDSIIKKDRRVLEYHDLHIHKPSSKDSFISLHIVLDDDALTLKICEEIANGIREELKHQGFNHILIQMDTSQWVRNHIHCEVV